VKAYRAGLLRFTGEGAAQYLADGMLVVEAGRIRECGDAVALAPQYPGVETIHLPGKVLAPGFLDIHLHYPQTDIVVSAADGLLPWLQQYTFPHEARFADAGYAGAVAEFFLDELLRQGVTTAMVYCSSHPESVDAFFGAAQARDLRMIAGKCLMDRHCPDPVRDETEEGVRQSEALIARWHGRGRLGYAITPRFAPSSTPRQLALAGELARRHPDVWVQTHVAENREEVLWALDLFRDARSYLDVYDGFGLLRPRSVYAHCIHLDETDRDRMAEAGAAAAVCPTSNLFLGSGLFDFTAAREAGMAWGLASDVGGGSSFSPFRTMLTAFEVGRLGGVTLSPSALWYHATAGAAAAIGLADRVGNLAAGLEADFLVLDPRATPLLARRTAQAATLDEWLFALIGLADDRAVQATVIAGEPRKPGAPPFLTEHDS
jgi:guanine deaminase